MTGPATMISPGAASSDESTDVSTAATSAEHRPGGEATRPAPAERGVLDIPPKVISRIAGHSVFLHAGCTDEPDTAIIESSTERVDLEVHLEIPYPQEPLGSKLNRLRRDVASDLAHQTGRRVGRLDLRVERFVDPPAPPRVL